MKITENCIVDKMPEDVYHSDPTPYLDGFAESTSLSSTTLTALIEGTEIEAKATIKRLNVGKEDRQSDSMDLGSIAHDYVLSGGEGLFEIAPFDNWRTKDSQNVRDDIKARGKIPLNNSTKSIIDDVKIMKMRLLEQINEHCDWAGVFNEGLAEQSMFYFDGDIWNRARTDWLVSNYNAPNGEFIENLIVDYKTTGLSFDSWEKNELWREKYLQDPHYRKVANGLLTNGKNDCRFIFVVQQTKEPFLVRIYEISPSYRKEVEDRYNFGRAKFIECIKTGVWKGYPPYTVRACPPPWIENKWIEEEQEADIIKSRENDKETRVIDVAMAG